MVELTIPSLLSRSYARNLREILALCRSLDEVQLRRRLPGTNSVVHDLWHIARWADHLQSIISEMTPELTARLGVQREIWVAEDLKRRWGMTGLNLGHVETGFGMDEKVAASMPLPPTPELFDYAERAVQAAISTVAGLTEDDLHQVAHVAPERSDWIDPASDGGDLVFGWVLDYLAHDAEHLGAMSTLAQYHKA